MPHPPRALVIRAAGTNCEQELVRAFKLAGAEPELVHLDRLVADPARLEAYDLIGFPGGFSYGDDIASGRIFAVRVREKLYPALRGAIERSCPIIGVCNGFQILVQVGLLPGPAPGEPWPAEAPPPQTVALTENARARFEDRWVGMIPEPNAVCVWTRGLDSVLSTQDSALPLQLPVAHGEGRFVASSPELIAELERRGQVVLRYADNYNGSEGAIAGICDASGLIFGLMPHPERFVDWTRHPAWTRLPEEVRRGVTPGLRIFRNAVEAAANVSV